MIVDIALGIVLAAIILGLLPLIVAAGVVLVAVGLGIGAVVLVVLWAQGQDVATLLTWAVVIGGACAFFVFVVWQAKWTGIEPADFFAGSIAVAVIAGFVVPTVFQVLNGDATHLAGYAVAWALSGFVLALFGRHVVRTVRQHKVKRAAELVQAESAQREAEFDTYYR